MLTDRVPDPWLSFLADIDGRLDSNVTFHCFGGFAIELLFGLPRETSDVDVLAAVVRDQYTQLFSVAGRGSALNMQYGLYLDLVSTIAIIPDDYDKRLIPI